MINRIYIIGGLRSGKSFMGNKLSERTGVSHFNLDEIVWIEAGKILEDEKVRNKKLENILKGDKWIVEGTYTEEWIVPALTQADLIVWLDTSKIVRLFRFIKQIIKGRGTEHNIIGRGKLILGFKNKKRDRSRNAYRVLLQPFLNKVIVLKSREDLNGFLKNI